MGVVEIHSEEEKRVDRLIYRIPSVASNRYLKQFTIIAHQWEVVFTLLAPHLEGVLIVSGPKLPKTGGKSTDDPLVIARDNNILVNVYTQLVFLDNSDRQE